MRRKKKKKKRPSRSLSSFFLSLDAGLRTGEVGVEDVGVGGLLPVDEGAGDAEGVVALRSGAAQQAADVPRGPGGTAAAAEVEGVPDVHGEGVVLPPAGSSPRHQRSHAGQRELLQTHHTQR